MKSPSTKVSREMTAHKIDKSERFALLEGKLFATLKRKYVPNVKNCRIWKRVKLSVKWIIFYKGLVCFSECFVSLSYLSKTMTLTLWGARKDHAWCITFPSVFKICTLMNVEFVILNTIGVCAVAIAVTWLWRLIRKPWIWPFTYSYFHDSLFSHKSWQRLSTTAISNKVFYAGVTTPYQFLYKSVGIHFIEVKHLVKSGAPGFL